jgi:hypothetical protein
MATSSNNATNYTKQADGTTAVTSTSTRNNRGIIATGATINNTLFAKFQPVNFSVSGLGIGTYPTDGSQTDKAVSAGTFAYNSSGVIVRVTTRLGNTNNSVMQSGSSMPDQTQSFNQFRSGTYRSYRYADFNRLTGTFTVSPSGISDGVAYNSGVVGTNQGSVDEASNPTRSIPGEYVFAIGSGVIYGNYTAKNGG